MLLNFYILVLGAQRRQRSDEARAKDSVEEMAILKVQVEENRTVVNGNRSDINEIREDLNEIREDVKEIKTLLHELLGKPTSTGLETAV